MSMETPGTPKSAEIISLDAERRKRHLAEDRERLMDIVGPALEEEMRADQARANALQAENDFYAIYHEVQKQLQSPGIEDWAILKRDVYRLCNVIEYIMQNGEVSRDMHLKMRDLIDPLANRMRNESPPAA